ncbi:hypothetical protein GCM10007036_03080 [Alsobacter metallidurans]|uniref:GtrA/DPMS transmembrane domain-containing protein n=1 Tax=Alsobacter metallidurans TaxID=340221 RepID=A0A917I2U0_9HYPH|nr:GtrA family protein [Alsobacter metallidurans]GGH07892.1 hypothetical protein GCM10007036_03080 [Alsobacter metallidurans]
MQEATALARTSIALGAAPPRETFAARFVGPRLSSLLAHPLAQGFAKFLSVGVVGLAVDASIFSALDHAHVAPELSRALSLLAATMVTWRLNRSVTFAASGRRQVAEAVRYAAVALMAQGFSYAVFLSIVYSVPTLPRLFALLAGAGLAAFAGFAGHRFYAFKPARAVS